MALALSAVEYEELPALFDPLAAMAEGALLLHPARGSTLVQALHLARGDPERGQAEADLVIEDPCTTASLWTREQQGETRLRRAAVPPDTAQGRRLRKSPRL
jgi:CO/xanthine dehydrogenase Mo-binding subunit